MHLFNCHNDRKVTWAMLLLVRGGEKKSTLLQGCGKAKLFEKLFLHIEIMCVINNQYMIKLINYLN